MDIWEVKKPEAITMTTAVDVYSDTLLTDAAASEEKEVVDFSQVTNSVLALAQGSSGVDSVPPSLEACYGVVLLVLDNMRRAQDAQDDARKLFYSIKSQQANLEMNMNMVTSHTVNVDEVSWMKPLIGSYRGALIDILTDIISKGNVTPGEIEANQGSFTNIIQRIAQAKLDTRTIRQYAGQLQYVDEKLQKRFRLFSIVLTGSTLMTVPDHYYMHMRRVFTSTAHDRKSLRRRRPPLAPSFKGYDETLKSLRRDHMGPLAFGSRSPKTSILCGLGGSGKTQIALQIASEYEKKNPSLPVYFLDARSKENLIHGLNLITETQTNVSEHENMVRMLETGAGWLIIMDGADDEGLDLASFIPQNSLGHLIITTRSDTLRVPSAKTYLVDALPVEDGERLLLDTAGYPLTEENWEIASEITEELWDLPMAIVQAAVYIRKHRCLGEFLEIYRSYHQTTSEHALSDGGYDNDIPEPVVTTIQMSLDQLPEKSYRFLQLLSFFHTASFISHDMLCRSAESGFRSRVIGKVYGMSESDAFSRDIGILQEIFCPSDVWSESRFQGIVQPCVDQSLLFVTRGPGPKHYSMHRLVQNMFQNQSKGTIHGLESAFVRLLGSSINEDNRMDLPMKIAMIPHIQLYMSRSSSSSSLSAMDRIEANLTFGMVARDCGYHPLALSLYQRAYKLSATTSVASMERDSTLALKIRADVALSYFELGQYQQSFSLFVEVYNLQAQQVGEDHPDTLWTLGNLSMCLHDVGRLEDALSLIQDAYLIQERVLGPNHEHTLCSMAEIARTLFDLGRHEEALDLRGQVFESFKKAYGEAHSSTVQAMARIGSSLGAVERHQRAVEVLEQAARLQIASLGEKHSKTLWTQSKLAHSLRALGRCSEERRQEAYEVNLKVWQGRVETLGKTHPHTLESWVAVATSLSDLGMNESARGLLEEAVKLQEATLGKAHPLTIRAKAELDVLRRRLQRCRGL